MFTYVLRAIAHCHVGTDSIAGSRFQPRGKLFLQTLCQWGAVAVRGGRSRDGSILSNVALRNVAAHAITAPGFREGAILVAGTIGQPRARVI